MKLVVIGGGVAGLAAAWQGVRAGADVTVVHGRAGASALWSGAYDAEPWPNAAAPRAISGPLVEFLAALGAKHTADFAVIATLAGTLRPARAHDPAVLDLAPFAGRRVGVLDLGRDELDARSLCVAWGSSAWAKATSTEFSLVSLPEFAEGARREPSWDFAARFDDAGERARLAAMLRGSAAETAAWLTGPWLGVRPGAAEALAALLGTPIGETTSPPGGAAGARFEARRDALLSELGVRVQRAEVRRLVHDQCVELVDGSRIDADALVLALGGVAGGGIVLEDPRPGHAGGATFRTSLESDLEFSLDRVAIDGVSTLHGVDFVARGLGALERVGVATQGARAQGGRSVLVAGDLRADEPRTALQAASTGIAAASAALE